MRMEFTFESLAKISSNLVGDTKGLQISGISYPQKALSALSNRAGIFNELRRAMGSLFNNNNSTFNGN